MKTIEQVKEYLSKNLQYTFKKTCCDDDEYNLGAYESLHEFKKWLESDDE